ncbi:MAG: MFS transporter [Gulosibacter sp.]|uniref:MFS transporter n=1 Tax=Gulosibacter sp. TaxID=2817531 RepID=UPI003F9020B3
MSATEMSKIETKKKNSSAIKSAYGAYYVDLLDIYLPVLVLPPALIYFVNPAMGAQAIAGVTAAIFVASLLGRPAGAVVFGPLADRIGKSRVAMISMYLSGAVTLAMGLLPGFMQIGWWSIALFILFRFLNGLFIGGQYSSAIPLAMEASPKHKRGFNAGLINSAFPAAYVTIALSVMLLTSIMPVGDIDSPYVAWGWRIPFILTGIAEVIIAINYQRNVRDAVKAPSDSEGKRANPLLALLKSEYRGRLIQVFVVMTGMWLAQQSVSALMPGTLNTTVGLEPWQSSLILMVAFAIGIPLNIAAGALSQHHGRRRIMLWLSAGVLILGTVCYLLTIQSQGISAMLFVFVTVCVVLTISPFAIVPAYISERFPVSVRATGYGVSYSLALIIPSFYAVYQEWLSNFMPFEQTAVVLLGIGAVVMFAGVLAGPETRDVEITD